jgi:hypothetical protein
MTAAQQWTKLRNPLESIPICWPRGADAEQISLSKLEMPRRDSELVRGALNQRHRSLNRPGANSVQRTVD